MPETDFEGQNFLCMCCPEDRKYYQNENKIYVTRPNVIENHTPNLGNLIGQKTITKSRGSGSQQAVQSTARKLQRVNSHGCFGAPRGKKSDTKR